MNNFILSIFNISREILSYFSTPIAYVFIVIFLLLSSLFTFYLGNFFELGQASLSSFFEWHPLVIFIFDTFNYNEAMGRRKKTGTIEFITTSYKKYSSNCCWKVFSCMGIYYNSIIS